MSPLEAIEEQLAIALTALSSAAGYVRDADELEDSPNLRHLGNAINAAWELRETVHALRPELKPRFPSQASTSTSDRTTSPTKISAAGNVEVPAYRVLVEKGYDVRCRGELWTATKGDFTFNGNGPIEVLGIVAMYECRGENWTVADEEIDAFLKKFPQD